MLDSQPPTDSAAATKCDTTAPRQSPNSTASGPPGDSGKIFDALRVEEICANRLTWLPQSGIGYLPVTASPYDRAYFQKYQGYAQTLTGIWLNAARVRMVARHWEMTELLDVGIGSGQFVASRPGTLGFDINPAAIQWLDDRGSFLDPYHTVVRAACFWDSLEHIPDPSGVLSNVSQRVFVSLPIFHDLEHALSSKHFRPDEHCWYFTQRGFLLFMRLHGWSLVEWNNVETQLGREDINSFAFRRV